MNSGTPRTGLPDSSRWPSWPFRLQSSGASRRRFVTLPLSSTGFRFSRSRLHLWHAGSPAFARPNRVRIPTD